LIICPFGVRWTAPVRDTDRHGIGCGEQTTIRSLDVGASRQHCRLVYDGRQVVLTDLNSANGTWSTPPDPGTPLDPSDVIQVGSARLAFLTHGTADATQMYTPTGPLPGLYRRRADLAPRANFMLRCAEGGTRGRRGSGRGLRRP
jgi:hypothetical protein